MCYVESGYPLAQSLVGSRQSSFLDDDPLVFFIIIVMEYRFCTRAYVENLLYGAIEETAEGFSEVKANMCKSTSSKRINYKEMNPSLNSPLL